MPRVRRSGILISCLIGGALGWLAFALLSEPSVVDRVLEHEPTVRREAWRTLLEIDPTTRKPHAEQLLSTINEHLLQVDDEAILLDAGEALRSIHAWGWTTQPKTLVTRELRARLIHAPGTIDIESTADLLAHAPRDEGVALIDELFATLMDLAPTHGAGITRSAITFDGGTLDLASLISWRDHPDAAVARHVWIAIAWSENGASHLPSDDALFEADQPVRDAMLFAIERHTPDRLRTLATRRPFTSDPFLSWLLAIDDSLAAWTLLETRGAAGDSFARSLLLRRSSEDLQQRLRCIIEDDRIPPALRRAAAWECRTVPMDLLSQLVDHVAIRGDGAVFDAALLLERFLPEKEGNSLIKRWLVDFDDDRKRVAALLAALRGNCLDALDDAFEHEQDPAVRTVQRVALMAHDRIEPDSVFLHRALAFDPTENTLNPDVLLALAAGKKVDLLRYLGTQPTSVPMHEATQWRLWMLERFAPRVHDALKPIAGADDRTRRFWFDAISVRGLTRARSNTPPTGV